MPMNSAQARDALYEMFKDAWDASDGWPALSGGELPVYYDNVRTPSVTVANGVPEEEIGKIEIMVQHVDTPAFAFGVGRPRYNATGFVVVKLYFPKDQGLTLGDGLVNIVKRAFQAKRGSGVADSLVLRGTTINEAGAEDRWFVIRTVTPFEYEDEVT